jgi:murein DD-endopeptidase MepM/ murein hydrolase activator NlpD
MSEEELGEKLAHPIKKPITSEIREWEPNQDTVLPIDGKDIPGFKEWINWNGFQLDRETGKGHDGFDFGAYLTEDGRIVLGLLPNTPIRAVADGIVAQVMDSPEAVGGGYGVTINLEHGANDSGMLSTYIHVVPLVEYGQAVKKGDVIATLYKDPDGEKGRLVHLHLSLISGWGTRGTPIMGGSKNKRLDDPKFISEEIYKYSAEPQGNSNFSVPTISDARVEIANFKKVNVNN